MDKEVCSTPTPGL